LILSIIGFIVSIYITLDILDEHKESELFSKNIRKYFDGLRIKKEDIPMIKKFLNDLVFILEKTETLEDVESFTFNKALDMVV